MKITKRQLKQIIKEELQEMHAFDPTQEMGAQGLSRDDTLYYEPEEGEEFPPGARVRYKDAPAGAEIVGTVRGLSKKYPDYIRVKWDRTTDFINARGQERPGHPSGPKATVSDVDPRLLLPEIAAASADAYEPPGPAARPDLGHPYDYPPGQEGRHKYYD